MLKAPEISEDDLIAKTETLGNDQITFLPLPEKALKGLKAALTGFFELSLDDFYLAYFIAKSALSPPTYQFAFLNKTGYSQKILLSDPFLWPVSNYYAIVRELMEYKKTGIVT